MLSPDTLALPFSLYLIEHIIYSFQINIILKYHCRHSNISLLFSLPIVHASCESWGTTVHLQISTVPHHSIKLFHVRLSPLQCSFSPPCMCFRLNTHHRSCDSSFALWCTGSNWRSGAIASLPLFLKDHKHGISQLLNIC